MIQKNKDDAAFFSPADILFSSPDDDFFASPSDNFDDLFRKPPSRNNAFTNFNIIINGCNVEATHSMIAPENDDNDDAILRIISHETRLQKLATQEDDRRREVEEGAKMQGYFDSHAEEVSGESPFSTGKEGRAGKKGGMKKRVESRTANDADSKGSSGNKNNSRTSMVSTTADPTPGDANSASPGYWTESKVCNLIAFSLFLCLVTLIIGFKQHTALENWAHKKFGIEKKSMSSLECKAEIEKIVSANSRNSNQDNVNTNGVIQLENAPNSSNPTLRKDEPKPVIDFTRAERAFAYTHIAQEEIRELAFNNPVLLDYLREKHQIAEEGATAQRESLLCAYVGGIVGFPKLTTLRRQVTEWREKYEITSQELVKARANPQERRYKKLYKEFVKHLKPLEDAIKSYENILDDIIENMPGRSTRGNGGNSLLELENIVPITKTAFLAHGSAFLRSFVSGNYGSSIVNGLSVSERSSVASLQTSGNSGSTKNLGSASFLQVKGVLETCRPATADPATTADSNCIPVEGTYTINGDSANVSHEFGDVNKFNHNTNKWPYFGIKVPKGSEKLSGQNILNKVDSEFCRGHGIVSQTVSGEVIDYVYLGRVDGRAFSVGDDYDDADRIKLKFVCKKDKKDMSILELVKEMPGKPGALAKDDAEFLDLLKKRPNQEIEETDETNDSPLHIEARAGNYLRVNAFLGNPLIMNVINSPNNDGDTPLDLASQHGDKNPTAEAIFGRGGRTVMEPDNILHYMDVDSQEVSVQTSDTDESEDSDAKTPTASQPEDSVDTGGSEIIFPSKDAKIPVGSEEACQNAIDDFKDAVQDEVLKLWKEYDEARSEGRSVHEDFPLKYTFFMKKTREGRDGFEFSEMKHLSEGELRRVKSFTRSMINRASIDDYEKVGRFMHEELAELEKTISDWMLREDGESELEEDPNNADSEDLPGMRQDAPSEDPPESVEAASEVADPPTLDPKMTLSEAMVKKDTVADEYFISLVKSCPLNQLEGVFDGTSLLHKLAERLQEDRVRAVLERLKANIYNGKYLKAVNKKIKSNTPLDLAIKSGIVQANKPPSEPEMEYEQGAFEVAKMIYEEGGRTAEYIYEYADHKRIEPTVTFAEELMRHEESFTASAELIEDEGKLHISKLTSSTAGADVDRHLTKDMGPLTSFKKINDKEFEVKLQTKRTLTVKCTNFNIAKKFSSLDPEGTFNVPATDEIEFPAGRFVVDSPSEEVLDEEAARSSEGKEDSEIMEPARKGSETSPEPEPIAVPDGLRKNVERLSNLKKKMREGLTNLATEIADPGGNEDGSTRSETVMPKNPEDLEVEFEEDEQEGKQSWQNIETDLTADPEWTKLLLEKLNAANEKLDVVSAISASTPSLPDGKNEDDPSSEFELEKKKEEEEVSESWQSIETGLAGVFEKFEGVIAEISSADPDERKKLMEKIRKARKFAH